MPVEGAASAQIEIARIAEVLQRLPGRDTTWLSESEQARYAAIGNDARRDQYLAGHWLSRSLLARAFGGQTAAWRLLEQRSRPPRVERHESLSISISHTSQWVAVAVATTAIGIDLEQRPRTLDGGIEPLLLNAAEAPGSVDADALLQRWVAKEAWIKRRLENALPARFKRIELYAVARDTGRARNAVDGTDTVDLRNANDMSNAPDVLIESNAAFHFGVSAASSCKLALRSEVPLGPGPSFRVVDVDA